MEWTGACYADKPTVEVTTWIAAAPTQVWTLVSDIELMPRISSELQSVEWLDGGSGPALGARFVGRSKHDALGEWATTSHIVEYEPPRTLSWAVEDPQHPTALWRFTLESQNGGTLLREWMQMGPARSGLSFAIDRMPDKEQKIVFVRMREFEANMAFTLEEIKKLAFSLGGMGSATTNFYNNAYSRQGWAEVAAEVRTRWQAGDRDDAANLITDEMVLATTLIGTEDMVRERLRVWRDVGVDTVRFYPAGESLDARLATLGRAINLVRDIEDEAAQ